MQFSEHPLDDDDDIKKNKGLSLELNYSTGDSTSGQAWTGLCIQEKQGMYIVLSRYTAHKLKAIVQTLLLERTKKLKPLQMLIHPQLIMEKR